MVFGYKEAFGLSDNPFGPRRKFRGVDRDLTKELENNPLLLHKAKDAELNELYCDRIPSFRNACQALEIRLTADGYVVADPPERGNSSYFVAVLGDRGSGKTTLASRMMQLMLKRSPEDEDPWHVDELLLDSLQQNASQQAELLKEFETRIATLNPKFLCVLVDDLLADAFLDAARSYRTLGKGRSVFFIFTSRDVARMTQQLDKAQLTVLRYKIDALTPDDVLAFVKARYQVFRLPSANGINTQPLFPFDPQDLTLAVKVRTFKGSTTTDAVTLRLVASILYSALANRLEKLGIDMPDFDAHAATPEKLREQIIGVALAYELSVRK